ncbi:LURP-one-related/scramblase family protein [Plantactinospora endophytica]|uniref:Uncharacterized protein n=1 Tax=Plantactinospora endophytica TaxID=673535 RepID=A0ABQ4E909_9ACTN|nr:hypothetical protein [Plantactinospora endophytica]GIG91203.1 hypothetical protein Pen02_61390 [Plantactinospora endophytica]
MLKARKLTVWRSRYEVTVRGRVVTTWDDAFWRSGGEFELDGQHYQVRGNAWGNRYRMLDAAGGIVASADRVGRKRWTVQAAEQTYHFQRVSFFGSEQELHAGGRRVGSVRRTSFWRGDVVADLPGLPLPVQIFVLGVVITMWNQQSAAAAASS